MPTDTVIVRNAKKLPIETIAARLGIKKEELIRYGPYIAKIDLGILKRLSLSRHPTCVGTPANMMAGCPASCGEDSVRRPLRRGKYVLVSAITPTPLGEGKTVTTIGLGMALNRLHGPASVCIRQPSLGPVFGIKGSAGGGGFAQVLPREDFDLHFTGDAHAVGLAHNIAAAFLDNSLFRGNLLGIDAKRVYWRRVVDIGDRCLRNVLLGCGASQDGIRRSSGFDITAASEIMAILALSRDFRDLRKRLGKIVLAETKRGTPVTTEDIKVAGLMAVLLKEAIKPNLIQTIENTPCFVHTGPFGNIAHGNSSIIQDRIALALSAYVVTEAGFGADCGAEKFFDIKCRVSGLRADAAVVVCSLRALKSHAGVCRVVAGKPLAGGLCRPDRAALARGIVNLERQVANIKAFGVPVVVAINAFDADVTSEIDFVMKKAREFSADGCAVSTVWQKGSAGGLALAAEVMRCASRPKKMKFLYDPKSPIKEKIAAIATKMYGAKGVSYTKLAEEKIRLFARRGWGTLPICMAKTHLSLSHDPERKGAPYGFTLPIRDIRAFAGAGFLSPLCGNIQTMPGLPSHPRGENIDIDGKGDIIGLS